MLVVFVSQCEKKALKRTREVLDAFANRIGDNTWQTAITEEGLKTVKSLLRKTATKSTAVSCHRVCTRKRTALMWIVGNKSKFNELGVVPVNWTRRNILHTEWENNWLYASSIQIVATLAALLHDLGKTTIGFQNKLHNFSKHGDPYRHEWISLKLFELLIADCESDAQWLARFVDIKAWLKKQKNLAKQFEKVEQEKTNIAKFPPLAQWVAWLIVTHHRLPPVKAVFYPLAKKERLKNEYPQIIKKQTLQKFYQNLFPIDYWVRNPNTFEEATKKELTSFWKVEEFVFNSPAWQKHIVRWANKALQDPALQHLSEQASEQQQPITDSFLCYLSRLALMMGDHNYSCLSIDDKRRVKGSKTYRKKLVANTDKGEIKQSLDEHLIGVARFTANFARFLPKLTTSLPKLKGHDDLVKHTDIDRFKWQNHAFKLARKIQKESDEHGFFGVNMASTGCGKTIGNARIMYGLADSEQGARITIALGLRVLTLQTGLSFKENLGLTDEQLAILVGGTANKKLFEYNQQNENELEIIGEQEHHSANNFGSESSEELIDETVISGVEDIDYDDYEQLNMDTLLNDKKARQLLFSPIVTCTIDHLMQASECKRAGRYMAPMLRLLSSDLILDEPDDFNLEDLPALSRLVHLAGLCGSRVLLSSATLTPDMISGLYQAYFAGRVIFNRNKNKATPKVLCAWFDEQDKEAQYQACDSEQTFAQAHSAFIQQRCQYLQQQPIRRFAEILPLEVPAANKELNKESYLSLANQMLQAASQLHQRYHQVDNISQKEVSIGLLRIANINNIIPLTKALCSDSTKLEIPENTHFHIACYHSRQILVLRNYLESRLDKILKRKEDQSQQLFHYPEIQQALQKSDAKKHIFIVIGSPVTEVGRDHDYDWAIVEPSSMRSIIQLAGRVWRHRPHKTPNQANIMLLQYNLNYFKNHGSEPVFKYPGFETAKLRLKEYDLNKLITKEQLQRIDAQARINDQFDENNPSMTLAQLEHQSMHKLLNNPTINFVSAYWSTDATSYKFNTHLQQISPFREKTKKQQDWIIVPDNESKQGFNAYYAEDIYENKLKNATSQNCELRASDFIPSNPKVSPWLTTSLTDSLKQLALYEDNKLSIQALATRYSTISLDALTVNNNKNWLFHPFLGFEK